MATLMGAWDCPYCGRKKNIGIAKNCAGCGAPRSADVKFYLPKDAQTIDDYWATVGVDWTCAACNGDNAADANNCIHCGKPHEKGDKKREVINYGTGPVPHGTDEPEEEDPYAQEEPPSKPQIKHERPQREDRGIFQKSPMPQPSTKRLMKIFGCVVAGLALFWGVWFFFIATEEIQLEVIGFSWDREIQIERYVWVDDSQWDSAPAGARNVSSKREIHHYEKVLDHYEHKTRPVEEPCGTETYDCGTETTDNGNGTFTTHTKTCTRTKYCTRQESYDEPVYRDDPVYRQKYYYEIQRWVVKRAVNSGGNDNELAPYWPKTQIGEGQYAEFEEREGGKSEEYVVYYIYEWKEKKEKHSEKLPQGEWSELKKGDKFTGDINRAGLIRNIRPAQQ